MQRFLKDNESINVLSSLPSVDLTEYGVRVLVALADGEKTSTEVAQIADIPRTKAYEVLNDLLAKGFVIKSKEEPLSFKLAENTFGSLADHVREDLEGVQDFLDALNQVRVKGYEKAILDNITSALKNLGCNIGTDSRPGDIMASSPVGFKICAEVLLDSKTLTLAKMDQLRAFRQNDKCDLILFICDFELTDLLERNIREAGVYPIAYDPHSIEKRIREAMSRFEEVFNYTQTTARKLEPLIESMEFQYHKMLETTSKMLEEISRLDSDELGRLKNEIGEGAKQLLARLQHQTDRLHEFRYFRDKLVHEVNLRYNKEIIERLKQADGEMKMLEKESSEMLNDVNRLSEIVKNAIEKLPQPLQLGAVPFFDSVLEQDVVDQQRFRDLIESYIRNSERLSLGSSMAFVEGDIGSGKSFMMIYYSKKIDKGDYGKNIAIYTQFERSFTQTLRSLVLKLADRLKAQYPSGSLAGYHKAFEEMLKLVGELKAQGYRQLFWFIDDFDRYLAHIGVDRTRILETLRRFFDMSASLPLRIFLSITPETKTAISKDNRALLSRIPETNTFRLHPFTEDDVREIIKRKGIENVFSDYSVIEKITRVSKGNPRRIFASLSYLLRYAAEHNVKNFDDESLRLSLGQL